MFQIGRFTRFNVDLQPSITAEKCNSCIGGASPRGLNFWQTVTDGVSGAREKRTEKYGDAFRRNGAPDFRICISRLALEIYPNGGTNVLKTSYVVSPNPLLPSESRYRML